MYVTARYELRNKIKCLPAFAIDGTGLPEVEFDIGESYAGLLPISDSANETRKLFFWFFPSTLEETPEEIVVW
jgi:carboxypeptidase D